MVDQTIIATALPAIAASTGQFERASWIVVAYLIAATIAAIAFVYAPARWSIGAAVAGLEFALILELLVRIVPTSQPAAPNGNPE